MKKTKNSIFINDLKFKLKKKLFKNDMLTKTNIKPKFRKSNYFIIKDNLKKKKKKI